MALLRRRWNDPSNRHAAAIGAALSGVCLLTTPRPALAGSFFDFLFGGPRPVSSAHSSRDGPAARGTWAPFATERVHEHGRRRGSGRLLTFCVRLCDGEAFPIAHIANATPVETCRAICPASPTKVFSGTSIDNATTADGARYGALGNAYLYRKQLVADCTCNGRDEFGLVPLPVADDPTLRPGDIVVTANGLVAYAGKTAQGQAYTPVDSAGIVTAENSQTSPPRPAQRMEPPASELTGTIVQSPNAPPRYLPPIADLRGQLAN